MKHDGEKAIYGFAVWVSVPVIIAILLVWELRLIPEGYYAPDQLWSLAVPALVAMTGFMYFIIVWSTGVSYIEQPSVVSTATDIHARTVRDDGEHLPTIGDLPIYEVSQRIYGN
eukprot:TRINITY_DN34442_c0_g1_i1.p1 TRINITY_DN34442_c0_g1~~TRINITY_DN34442_c0_g1_i1.p1  ORF type:complete len:114 (+),score=15.21 TRINITY_DN34442_c0_g1_i1:38-379(+)